MKFILTLLTLIVSIHASAWREGNGGDGVLVSDQIFLLDLVESGLESSEEPSNNFQHPFFQSELSKFSKNLAEPIPEKIILNKLGSIYQKNKALSLVLLAAMQKLNWRWVNFQLNDLHDEGKLHIPREQLVQLALRVNQTVQIQKNHWNRLNERNKAALIFHEVIYALMVPQRTASGIDMNSVRVRALTSFLFSPELGSQSLDLILRTEAPHLSFPTSLEPHVQPQWDKNRESLLINQQWFALHTTNESSNLSKVSIFSPKIEKWRTSACDLSLESKLSYTLGFNADKITVQFEQRGEKENQEFFLASSFQWQHNFLSIQTTVPLDTANCLKENIYLTNHIEEQILNKFKSTNINQSKF